MKVFEIVTPPEEHSEWENVPIQLQPDKFNHQVHEEKQKKIKALRREEDMLANKLVALEKQYPTEILSRCVLDENDMESEVPTDMPPAVEQNPEAFTKFDMRAGWTYDMRMREEYTDGHEEYFVLKSSPRYQLFANMFKRSQYIRRLISKDIRAWPPTVQQ